MRFSGPFLARGKFWFVTALVIGAQGGCGIPATEQEPILSLNLMSSSLSGDTIPDKYTCGGQDISPQLSSKTPPARTQICTGRNRPGLHPRLLAGVFRALGALRAACRPA
jgi:hypothetical protein